jgi:hypothetical protein
MNGCTNCLKTLYAKVEWFSGSGDCGIDITGFADPQKFRGVWDSYQCKHYDHALRPETSLVHPPSVTPGHLAHSRKRSADSASTFSDCPLGTIELERMR